MPTRDDISAAVDTWFAERIKSGAIAQYTPAYNQAYEALPDLKARLGALLPPAPPPPESLNPAPEAPADASEKD